MKEIVTKNCKTSQFRGQGFNFPPGDVSGALGPFGDNDPLENIDTEKSGEQTRFPLATKRTNPATGETDWVYTDFRWSSNARSGNIQIYIESSRIVFEDDTPVTEQKLSSSDEAEITNFVIADEFPGLVE